MEEDDIINNDFLIDPRAGAGISGIATSAEPLLAQGSRLADIQEVEPGAFVDLSSVTSLNDLFNYYLGGMPSQQPVAETPAVEAGAVTTPVVDTGSQDQATGDLGLIESGDFGGQPTFTTTPGTTIDSTTGEIINPDGTSGGNIVDEFTNTIGTFGGSDVITATPQPGTQVDSETGDITAQDGTYLGNVVDEFGTAGDVYSGAQGPTGIGTGDVLDEFGTAGDVYSGASTSGGVVDEAALTGAAGSPPSIESLQPPAIQEPLITPTDILLAGVGGVLDIPLNLGITAAQAAMPTQPDLVDPNVNIDEFAPATPLETAIGIDPTPSFYGSPAYSGSDSGSDSDTSSSPSPSSSFDYESEAYGTDSGGGGGSSGGGKIVCTMMNETYGFGSFRNKIWQKYAKDNLTREHEKGYHKIFLPLVKLSKTNIVIRKILEHIAVHRTMDIRQESRGKTHILGRVYRKVLEPICYLVGKYVK